MDEKEQITNKALSEDKSTSSVNYVVESDTLSLLQRSKVQTTLTTPVTLTVSYSDINGNNQNYMVTVPEEISFGELSYSNSKEIEYEILVEIEDEYFIDADADIIIASDDGYLERENDKISFGNNLNAVAVSNSKTLAYSLTVDKLRDEIAEGEYNGTVNFDITFNPHADTPPNVDINIGEGTPPARITNGLQISMG